MILQQEDIWTIVGALKDNMNYLTDDPAIHNHLMLIHGLSEVDDKVLDKINEVLSQIDIDMEEIDEMMRE